ncbi:hypothetical protein [Actinomadura rudentiformis]|uniref:Uncharacterized protein n=1 Tax=Actinomadura rudentiformis TaxID=359158 RepID=A0A6H9YWI0_9ACTN|nr:hypothetical protein [Actinomadura rudentiformis]KAB2346089.1 hypothetical protein F8566_25660 [Actinomadura rudentiformis]
MTQDVPAPDVGRLVMIGAVLLCSIGTLGVVSNASAPLDKGGRAPGIADLFRINAGRISVAAAVAMALAAVLGLLALRWSVRRSWPWLLLAGVALTLPNEYAHLIAPYDLPPGGALYRTVSALTTGAAQLVLIGTLGAGIRLCHIGERGVGAALIGAGFGAQIFGASTDVWFARILILGPGGNFPSAGEALKQLVHDGMILAAIGGAFLLAMLHRNYGDRPELAGPDRDPGLRVTLAGSVAMVSLIPAALLADYRTYTITGSLVLLVTAIVCAAAAGVRATIGTAVATAALVGMSSPAAKLINVESLHPVRLWFWVALGVVTGGVAAYFSRRNHSAAIGCGTAAVLLPLMSERSTPGNALLLGLLVAGVTALIASIDVWADPSSPAVLGALVVPAVLGGHGLLTAKGDTGTRDRVTEPLENLWVYVALLLLAAASMAVLAFLETRARARPTSVPA